MPKGIVIGFEGEVSAFGITRVDREKLYGKKARVVVDESGNVAVAALLTQDGSALIPPGGAASLQVDDRFDCYERSELRAVDRHGNPVPPVPSTLGVEQAAEKADATDVLDHITTALYQLAPETLGDKLKETLEAGGILKTRFNYRDDFDDAPAFLLKNEHGYFALIAQPTLFDYVEREAPVVLPDETAEGEDSEDLDFSML